mgnify:CR=1 FL=1
MQRTVITPADFSGDALDDLKAWLGISRPQEDALLTDLLQASAGLCEAFIGQSPIEQTIEETAPPSAAIYHLTTRPVRMLDSAETIASDGARAPLLQTDFEFAIDATSTASFRLRQAVEARAVAIQVRAGIAPDWSSLPKALKQGMIRLAAFHYRDRETGLDSTPPASVTALWRPWRTVRLT